MANTLKAPRGTMDVLPGQTRKWQYVEDRLRAVAGKFGFGEVRFPTFEYTELFSRGVGETTDVVQKEMYTFEDRGGRSITLRPEGTASTVRTLLQHGLHNEALPLKMYYIISCFRGERPQAGRLREFHQFGAEMFGAAQPAADAELIGLPAEIFRTLGLKGLELRVNSIGCPDCRQNYYKALREYFSAHAEELCETCRDRLERNPMRILDCKEEGCKRLAAHAPVVLDYICGDCRAHFDKVQKRLQAAGIGFTVDPSIVRGLDYYTRTVFEFVDAKSGLTVCGGGRYDGLVKELGGPALPGLGFGIGLERLLMVLEPLGLLPADKRRPAVYLAPMGAAASLRAARLCAALRRAGVAAEYDLIGRSVRAQMKYADKAGFAYTAVLGDDELSEGRIRLRSMAASADAGSAEAGSAETEFALDDGFAEKVAAYITGE